VAAACLGGLVGLSAGGASAEEAPQEAPRPKGWALQGLPILNYNVDEGLGYGTLLMLVDRADGNREPYRYSLFLQLFWTTRSLSAHKLTFDAPDFLQSRWRLGVDVLVGRGKFTPYYGLGNTSRYVPELGTCEDRDALAGNPDVCPGNASFRGLRYYTYDQENLPRLSVDVRRALGGPWRLLLGYRFRWEQVRARYSAEDLGQSGDSKLIEDAAAGLLVGYDGRSADPIPFRSAELTAGIQYDTRDIEAAPTRGLYHELSVRGASGALGSAFDYWGATLHARAWHTLVPGYRRLVVGGRGLLDAMGGDVPFIRLSSFGGLDGKDGIGGVYSARGIPKNRFQGPVKLLLNAELRWTPFSVRPWGQEFDFTLVGFVDSGRAWSDLHLRDAGGLKASAGGGLHIAWNREFLIRADYGAGLTEEGTGFYLEFGQLF
jgi:hypothetical protein